MIADLIRGRHPGLEVELRIIRTKGDIMQNVALSVIGGKGVFIKEIEEALLRNDVDLAVHSMKDVPAELPDKLEIAVTPLREDPRDVLISKGGRKLAEMPPGAKIGTGSLRRELQLKNRFPGFEIVPMRGNLDTRIRKLDTENLSGVILAAAGIARMGWSSRVSQFIPVDMLLPAVGQGVLGLETRRGDDRSLNIIEFLNDPVTFVEAGAERAFLERLGGGCQLPIAGFAKKNGGKIVIEGMVGSLDGKVVIRERAEGEAGDYRKLGRGLAETILLRGGDVLLAEINQENLS
ncbi:MAG: hydroxymethylbilane synthase [Syntrophobacterales bacterium]|nr:hydroxymethylbilane synthase [Syntrophobacterales bacterium]